VVLFNGGRSVCDALYDSLSNRLKTERRKKKHYIPEKREKRKELTILSTVIKKINLSAAKDTLLSERPDRKMVIFTTFLVTLVGVVIEEKSAPSTKIELGYM